MKKTLMILALVCIVFSGFTQSEKYIKAMEAKIPAIDTTQDPQALTELANSFERIADAEKTQWLPYYYASLVHVLKGYMLSGGSTGVNASLTDPEADKADELLKKAEALAKDNSEIWCVKKMIATLKMMADPMNRYMTYGQAASSALAKAKELDPENPRVYLLEGQDKMFTPEQYGGNKTEAKVLFETAQKKMEAFKPESPIDPQWGKNQITYFLSQLK